MATGEGEPRVAAGPGVGLGYRAAALGIGALFGVASWLKVSAPESFLAVVTFLFPFTLPRDAHLDLGGLESARAIAGLVVAWEAFLAAGLILAGGRRWIVGSAIATLVVFSAALGYLAIRPDAPSCSCFGPLGSASRAGMDLWTGLVRNAAMLTCLVWMWATPGRRPPANPRGASGATTRSEAELASASSAARGFTLVELLVVLAVLMLLLAMVIPTLRGSKRQAMQAAGFATQRQLLAGLELYASDFGGQMPYLARRGDPLANLEGPASLNWDGYFRDQSQHWHTLVNPRYVGLPSEAIAVPESLAPSGVAGRYAPDGTLHGVRYHLTHTAFAAPALWRDRTIGEQNGLDLSLLRSVRLDEVQAPGSKGLLIDIAMGFMNPDGDPLGGPGMPVGWADGSVSLLDLSVPDRRRYVLVPPLGASGWPVWSTKEGVAGRDRD
ncbi:MAG: prepilin-type N-terminal cleavage/methylation domain-containing protein [Phycisphaerales bacterium]|nr:prepilin-type N-terminal cleavage/methylation domain-containing protein [Phycisphaerales bacterium]